MLTGQDLGSVRNMLAQGLMYFLNSCLPLGMIEEVVRGADIPIGVGRRVNKKVRCDRRFQVDEELSVAEFHTGGSVWAPDNSPVFRGVAEDVDIGLRGAT